MILQCPVPTFEVCIIKSGPPGIMLADKCTQTTKARRTKNWENAVPNRNIIQNRESLPLHRILES